MKILSTFIFLSFISQLMATTIKIETIKANGFEFTCRTIGNPSDGPAVILLHGFPETSHMWESTMEHLHKKGYYCMAPDMRGYSSNARPKGVKNYSIQAIAKDVILIAEEKGLSDFHLMGHDWGSAVGWAIVGLYPQQVKSWVALSVPHLTALGKAVKYDEKQKKMSSYARTFQLRWLPESILKAKDFERLEKACWYLSSPEQVVAYKSVFGEKRALTSALNYYRKNWKKMITIAEGLNISQIEIPTTLIWGSKDTALGRKSVEDTQKYMKGDYELVELEASHWLVQDQPEQVWKAMDEHLKRYH